MSENDRDLIETDLSRLKPARPPEDFLARLVAVCPTPSKAGAPLPRVRHAVAGGTVRLGAPWRHWPRWLIPAAATVLLVVGFPLLRPGGSKPRAREPVPGLGAQPALEADDIQIDRQLVAAFDAIAHLPGGEPVRLRCREWTDEVVMRDSARGITIERHIPRVEVVPVGLEIY